VTERDFNGGKPAVVRRVLRALPVADTIAFFHEIGISLHEEPHGKLFPDTNRARDVLDALLRELSSSGAHLYAGTRVHDVVRDTAGLKVVTGSASIHANAVVLATGGLSLPKSGSDGAGIEIARRLGHTIVPTTPALVPLILAGGSAALHTALAGVAHESELSVWIDGTVQQRIQGALLWTHFGISGPVVLDASRHWLRAQREGRDARVTASFYPGERFESIDARWTERSISRPRASLQTALAADLPGSLAASMLQRLEFDGSVALAHLSREHRRRLSHALAAWPLDITASRGYNYAEVTAGGVALDEIDPASMASRKCPGLYLIGEILDVDGRIGGFNFQWAWSSARAAARGLARQATAAGARAPR
jgi:predicted Rossmann fold flavoprotein